MACHSMAAVMSCLHAREMVKEDKAAMPTDVILEVQRRCQLRAHAESCKSRILPEAVDELPYA